MSKVAWCHQCIRWSSGKMIMEVFKDVIGWKFHRERQTYCAERILNSDNIHARLKVAQRAMIKVHWLWKASKAS